MKHAPAGLALLLSASLVGGGAARAVSSGVSALAGVSVLVDVSNVRDARGHVLVALCDETDFLTARCPYHGAAPARPGTVLVRIDGVAPGRYAAEVFHDDTDTRKLERGLFGLPRKGFGFSRDARMRFGPPRFDDASFDVSKAGVAARTGLALRYP